MGHLTGSYEDEHDREQVVYRLGQALNAELNLPELLLRIVDAAMMLGQANEGWVILPDPATGEPRIRARRRTGAQQTEPLDSITADPAALQVLATGQSIRLPTGKGRVPSSQAAPHLYTPIIHKANIRGVIVLRRAPNTLQFADFDETRLAGLAGYAAIAIENARLYEQALESNRELSMLLDSASAVSSSLDTTEVLAAVSRQMMRAINVQWCIISAYDSSTGTLRRMSERFMAVDRLVSRPYLLQSDAPMRLWALKQGRVTQVNAHNPEPRTLARELLEPAGLSSMLLVPLQIRGSALGLAELFKFYDAAHWNEATIAQVMRVALQLAYLIRGGQGQGGLTGSVLENQGRALLAAAGADGCIVYVLNPVDQRFERALALGGGDWPDQSGQSIAATNPMLRVVAEEQRIAITNHQSARLEPDSPDLFARIGPGTMLGIPLIFQSKTVGIVQLYDLNPLREFTPSDLRLVQAMAIQAAVALENAGLVSDLQRMLNEQRSLQSQLVRAVRFSALGEMTTMIAHQVNNPLTTILADAEMLVQDLPVESQQVESARAILRAGQRAKSVIDRLLNMARSESAPDRVDVNATLQEAIALIRGRLGQHRIKLDLALAEGLPPVQGVSGQLEDVWLNLISNAIDAIRVSSAHEGHIVIRSEAVDHDQGIRVTITDNGIGIRNEDLPHLFNPFFTTKPPGKGTGLGLYICEQIIGDHGGDVRITGAPGEGATATVHLPTMHKNGTAHQEG